MLSDVRRKLEMAVRVRDFLKAHPFTDPSHQAIGARFGDLVTRAQALAVQEQSGRMGSAAANRRRRELRQDIEVVMIRYLRKVADLASREDPDIAGRFRMPSRRAPNATFMARGWDLIAAAREHQELLGRHGLSANHLDEVTSALNRLEAAAERANAGRREHMGARAKLLEVTAEIMELVGLMDVINRTRFRADAEPLGAWTGARDVLGPFRRKPRATDTIPPAAGPEDRAA